MTELAVIPRQAAPVDSPPPRRPPTPAELTTAPVLEVLAAAGDERVAQLVAAWLLSFGSPHTRDAYARDLRAWLHWLDHRGVAPLEVGRADADAYTHHLTAQGLKPGTIRRKKAAVSSFYSYAEDAEVIGRNRVRKSTKPPRPKGGRTGALTEAQVRKLLRVADRWVAEAAERAGGRPLEAVKFAHRARVLIYLLAGLGIRASEARMLCVEDLDAHAGHRRARFTVKGGKDVYRRVPERLDEVIGEYLAITGQRTTGPLLATRKGGFLQRAEVGRILGQLAARAGVRVHPHKMRATFVTVSLAHGRDIEEVRKAVGHADRAQTEEYRDRGEEMDRDPSVMVAEIYT